jgi:hypothetical protein
MIEVLKQMVEALEWCHGGEPIGTAEAIKAGKQAIAELERQEPVAWMDADGNTFPFVWNVGVQQGSKYLDETLTPLYTYPPQRTEQDPVAWLCKPDENGLFGLPTPDKGCKDCFPVYRQSQRTWVGLAAEDRLTAKYMQDAPDGIEAVIDYLEAKLKQKNGYAEEKNT